MYDGLTSLDPITWHVDRDGLILGVAAVFAGITVVMTVLALSRSLFLLFVALPFGLASYFMWYQASGRVRIGRARGTRRVDPGGRRDGPGRGGPDAAQSKFAREARERIRQERARAATGERPPPGSAPTQDGMSKTEAYRTLGVDPEADEGRVKAAYRQRVKEVHPDSGGDEEEFKRVTQAYETLTR